eukprot:m.191311 g.191311  ORF g.191311 m.191311 type:complete len:83 (-) comp32425_c0_seq1:10-258(-)
MLIPSPSIIKLETNDLLFFGKNPKNTNTNSLQPKSNELDKNNLPPQKKKKTKNKIISKICQIMDCKLTNCYFGVILLLQISC